MFAADSSVKWTKTQLGDYEDRSGLYIHHCEGKILYIRKTTTGQIWNFGERLCREFQERGSQSRDLFQILNSQTKAIKTILLNLNDLDKGLLS